MRPLQFLLLATATTACVVNNETPDTPPCPSDTAVEPEDTGDPGDDPSPLTDEEIAALASWTSHTVDFVVFPNPDDPTETLTVTGNRISIEVDRWPEELDYVNTLTRARDYNSSRSNNSSARAPAGGTGCCLPPPPERIKWGSIACTSFPCLSGDRDEGDISRALIDLSDATGPGERLKQVGFAETTPVDIVFTGLVAVSCKKCTHRGHVTVLKASSNANEDGVWLTSSAPWVSAAIYGPDSNEPLYRFKDYVGDNPLAEIVGTTGNSWPNGVEAESSAIGTFVSLTW